MTEPMTAVPSSKSLTPDDEDIFTKTSQTGWHNFGRFLLGNVVAVVICLVVIGFLTVWS